MTDRRPLIAGNWKMNLNHLEAIHLVQQLAFSLNDKDFDEVDVLVIPPFTDLRSIQTVVDSDRLRLWYGAQDLSVHDSGAYTGDISGTMLAKLGCSHVLVGHSERREHHKESDEVLAAKVAAALRHGLVPILCVGEGLESREAGEQIEVVLGQLDGGLEGISDAAMRTVVVAYEPVWAIGTGKVAEPEDAEPVCAAIRARISERHGADVAAGTRVLYGGSVKAANTAAIMAMPNIDGVLVGGASLDAGEFVGIARYRLS